MTKQQFMDQFVISMAANPNVSFDQNYFKLAEEQWEFRAKSERVVGEKKLDDSEAKESYWIKFWNAYDKKSGTGAAKEKFLSLNVGDMEVIVNKAAIYAKSTPEIKYRKLPITWLNQKCWLDSPSQDGKPQTKFGFV
jgi:hypothetical protein